VEILARTVQAARRYGPVTARDGVCLDVPAAQLLGPNGAGKNTLLQLLAGLRQPGPTRTRGDRDCRSN
jgi:ABC-2 type transport system ATP-binding protein